MSELTPSMNEHEIREVLNAIPPGNEFRCNRYDTDNQLVLHIWSPSLETSWDIRLKKRELLGREDNTQ